MALEHPLLLVDMDGPLAGLDDSFFEKCSLNGWNLDIDCVASQTRRFISEHVSDPDHHRQSLELLDAPWFFRELPVVPGAREGIDALLSADLEIWLCTKPLETSNTSRDEKAAWVHEHFPEFDGKILMVPDKSLAKGDVLLDDAIPLNWLGRSYWTPMVFTMPYNGEGSVWEKLPHFSWSDPVDGLISFCRRQYALKHRPSISRHKERLR
mgnify:CR=1 FL=1